MIHLLKQCLIQDRHCKNTLGKKNENKIFYKESAVQKFFKWDDEISDTPKNSNNIFLTSFVTEMPKQEPSVGIRPKIGEK